MPKKQLGVEDEMERKRAIVVALVVLVYAWWLFAPQWARPETLKGAVALDAAPLEKIATLPESPQTARPAWLPAGAWTNDQLLMHYIIGGPAHRRGDTTLLMSNITEFWQPNYGPCSVALRAVHGAPGNYSFRAVSDPLGPRGFIQDTTETVDGVGDRIYRYWFCR